MSREESSEGIPEFARPTPSELIADEGPLEHYTTKKIKEAVEAETERHSPHKSKKDKKKKEDKEKDKKKKKEKKEKKKKDSTEDTVAATKRIGELLLAQLADPEQMDVGMDSVRDLDILQDFKAAGLLGWFTRQCAARGFLDVIQHVYVVDKDAIDEPDKFGRTPLHWAMHRAQFSTANRLLDFGANPKLKTTCGDNPLHTLAKRKITVKASKMTQLLAKAAEKIVVGFSMVAAQMSGTSTGTASEEGMDFDNGFESDFSTDETPTGAGSSSAASGASASSGSEKSSQKGSKKMNRRSAALEMLRNIYDQPSAQADIKDLDENAPWQESNIAVISPDDNTTPSTPTAQTTTSSTLSTTTSTSTSGSTTTTSSGSTSIVVTPETKVEPMKKTLTEEEEKEVIEAVVSTVSPPDDSSASSGQKKDTTEQINWNQFSDEGALRNVVPEFMSLVKNTIRRLCSALDFYDPNDADETALMISQRNNNELIQRFLKEIENEINEAKKKGGKTVLGFTVPDSFTKMLSSQLKQRNAAPRVLSAHGYIRAIREINDEAPLRKMMRPLPPYTKGQKYRILSMDGGGIRCIFHPIMLCKILEKHPDFLDKTAFFCGCSGSSAMVCGLQLGLTAAKMKKFMILSAQQTLSKQHGNQLTSFKFTSEWMRMIYDLLFGDIRFKDLPRASAVPAFLMDNGMDTESGKRTANSVSLTNVGPDNGDFTLTEACMRSSAAPTFFRCFQGYLDGGVFANNPAGIGLPIAIGPPPNGLGVDVNDIVCLSLGTGFSGESYLASSKYISSGGILDYRMSILSSYELGQKFFIDNSLKTMLGDRFLRFSPTVSGIRLDEIAQIGELQNRYEHMDITPIMNWIDKYWY